MIEKISVENKQPRRDSYCNNQSFTGLGNGIITAVQLCEKYPMVNVTALDLSTAIIPRTVIETKESNGYAGFEAFRRESSGLIVNCLIPSFIVMGVAKLLQRPIMGNFKKSNLVNTWANSDSIDKIHEFYKNSTGTNSREKVHNTFVNMLGDLSGVDADKTVEFSKKFDLQYDSSGKVVSIGNTEIKTAIDKLTDAVVNDKFDKKKVKEAYKAIVKETHVAENIKFKNDKSFFSNNLESICDDTVKMLRGVVKEGITDNETQLSKYFNKAQKLVNWKSVGGLGLIIPLAISMQPINRWITRKTSGQKGAPIYKDFGENKIHKEMTPKEKRELFGQKIISVGSMIGVAALSMFMDKPSLKMFQFKGLFPTMDQARIISTATFASRMAASEDKNELREATVRDIATFSSFYFLGDYVAKGIATLFEKKNKNVHLINRLKEPNKNANALQKFWDWAKHTTIKSSDELTSVTDKRLRTVCQLGNIAFSLIALGILIPFYTRSKTNKKRAEELAKLNETSRTGAGSEKFSQKFLKNNTTFKSFFNS